MPRIYGGSQTRDTDIYRVRNTRLDTITKSASSQIRLATPIAVLIGGIAIITTRCLDLLLSADMLGLQGIVDFFDMALQHAGMSLLLLASLGLFVFEVACAVGILRGRNWGRYGFLSSQLIVILYLWLASLGLGYPELFRLQGETLSEIVRGMIVHKLPDLLVLFLLFAPPSSRFFFRRC